MAKKQEVGHVVEFTITLDEAQLYAMSIAERKGTIEQTFEDAKQQALKDFGVRANG